MTLTQGTAANLLLRLYHPPVQGTCFYLDGFPALKEGKDWQTRLREFIEVKGTLGMTTNQSLFRQLLETGALDGRLRLFKTQGLSAEAVYQTLYNEAALEAARLFGAVHARWPSEGRVSQEASALLTDREPLVREVQRIAQAMRGFGAFTKIPNLRVGPQAIRQAVASGRVQPNITLVFSDRHYLDTVEGYLLGLQDMVDGETGSPAEIYSVNSLFVSRVDRLADPMIEETLRSAQNGGAESLKLLKGKVAVAQAKVIYRMFEAVFLGKPFADPQGLYADEEGRAMLEKINRLRGLFARLAPAGAPPQRLLIASSGVKSDQPYHPLLYVLPFLGPWCANTMPEPTLEATARFAGSLSDEQAAALRQRNLMSEGLAAVATDLQTHSEWERILLLTPAQRRTEGIAEWTPDRVLREAHQRVFAPRNTSLRALCDALRDKGADSFMADERATLELIRNELQKL